MEKLIRIAKKYRKLSHNEDNFGIGGGLSNHKFASKRHEDAKNDIGKETMGFVVQMFKRATDKELHRIKEMIHYTYPNLEWHHAGKLPKSFGGGMKKTYFLKADEIVFIAENWEFIEHKIRLRARMIREHEEEKQTLVNRQLEFLQKKGTRKNRTETKPVYFILEKREMKGKHGWFDSTGKDYKLQEYYTGWKLDSQDDLNEFYLIK